MKSMHACEVWPAGQMVELTDVRGGTYYTINIYIHTLIYDLCTYGWCGYNVPISLKGQQHPHLMLESVRYLYGNISTL